MGIFKRWFGNKEREQIKRRAEEAIKANPPRDKDVKDDKAPCCQPEVQEEVKTEGYEDVPEPDEETIEQA